MAFHFPFSSYICPGDKRPLSASFVTLFVSCRATRAVSQAMCTPRSPACVESGLTAAMQIVVPASARVAILYRLERHVVNYELQKQLLSAKRAHCRQRPGSNHL